MMTKNVYKNSSSSAFAGFTFLSIVLALLTYVVLHWLKIPKGDFSDWVIGIITFGWLMTIVTVPWNIHFEAKQVIIASKISKERQIQVNERELLYAKKIARIALLVAFFLHIATAGALYWLAHAEVSIIGYFGAIASLILTFVRPAVRLYQYIAERLAQIHREVLYPREDVISIRNDVNILKNLLSESDEYSWYNQQQDKVIQFTRQLEALQNSLNALKTENQKEHQHLAQSTQHAVAQLNEEGKFMEHIAEIIRFVKKY